MEMRQDTKISLTQELLEEGVPKSHIARHLEISRRTVIRWSQGIQEAGSLAAFLEVYHQAKCGPRRKRKRDADLQRRIHTLRLKHRDCCGQKLQYFLEKEYGQQVSVTTIYKVLREQFTLRSKWQTNQLLAEASQHLPAASYAANLVPGVAFLLSLLLEKHKQAERHAAEFEKIRGELRQELQKLRQESAAQLSQVKTELLLLKARVHNSDPR